MHVLCNYFKPFLWRHPCYRSGRSLPACSYKDLKLDRALKAKWQEKSELIGKLEKEVVEMRNNFKEKEKTLTDERDKAIQAAK